MISSFCFLAQDQGVIQNYFIVVCGQNILYPSWVAITIVYKLALHIVALILAFLTRKIEIDALNDSKYSVVAIYCSSFILIMLIFTVSSFLTNPNLDDSSFCVLVVSLYMIFLGITFLPKVVN